MATTARETTIVERWFKNLKYEHLIAGISGGLASTLILHPLDLLKIRFAVNDGRHQKIPQYKGIFNAVSTIARTEGFVGLYRGVVPNMCGSGSAWGLYFLFYNSMKSQLQRGDNTVALHPAVHLLAAAQSGIMTLFITNPIWVVKTRMCLQYSNNDSTTLKYNGMVDALKKIYKSEGIKGYYKGIVPGIFGVSHGAVQFMAYEEMKNKYNLYKNVTINTKLTNIEYLSFAALSKVIAVACTYPYQVVRARLQNQYYSYTGSLQCISETWKHEGYKGFYKGLGTNLLRVTPATMITFVVYENVTQFLMKK